METGFILKLALFLSLAVAVSCAQPRPLTCELLECPTYKVVESGNGYEIRQYNSPVWMSTGPIPSSSLKDAGDIGFKRLFSYIGGNNKSKTKMSMTAPVVIQPGQSAYSVLFYLGKQYQSNPPLADGLTVTPWKQQYAAVRQFGGFMTDVIAKNEAAALMASVKGSKWIGSIEKSKGSYLIAGYNPPFQLTGRTNEIMVPFDM